MPKGNRPLAVRRKPPVQLFNVVFGQGDPSAVNPCPTRQPFQSQPPRKSVPEQRTGKRTRRTRTNDSRHVEIAVGHSQDRKSTRLNPVTNAHLVSRLLLAKKKQT